jgi:hypothetical protein
MFAELAYIIVIHTRWNHISRLLVGRYTSLCGSLTACANDRIYSIYAHSMSRSQWPRPPMDFLISRIVFGADISVYYSPGSSLTASPSRNCLELRLSTSNTADHNILFLLVGPCSTSRLESHANCFLPARTLSCVRSRSNLILRCHAPHEHALGMVISRDLDCLFQSSVPSHQSSWNTLASPSILVWL